MSVLTANPRITKTSHTTLVAAGLAALPVVLLLAAAYGASVIQAVVQAARVAPSTGWHLSGVSADAAIAGITVVIVLTMSYVIQEFRSDRDQDDADDR